MRLFAGYLFTRHGCGPGAEMGGCVLPVDHDLAVAAVIAYAAAGDCGATYAYAGLIVRAVCAAG